jgi:hypothetical protein
VSRKSHGTGGDFDLELRLSGEPAVESRNSAGQHTVLVTFTNPLMSGNAAIGSGTGTVNGGPTFANNTMTVHLSGDAGLQTLTLLLRNVTDSFSHVMPETSVRMTTLVGDTNGNRTVNAGDSAQTKAASGVALDSSNFRADVNRSGSVTASDVGEAKAAAANTVP